MTAVQIVVTVIGAVMSAVLARFCFRPRDNFTADPAAFTTSMNATSEPAPTGTTKVG